MNINGLIRVILFVFFISESEINAQSTYQFGILPSFNLNYKLKNDWSLNSKVEARYLIQNGVVKGVIFEKNNYVLTDFSLVAAKKWG